MESIERFSELSSVSCDVDSDCLIKNESSLRVLANCFENLTFSAFVRLR